jgi:hypothetical protein
MRSRFRREWRNKDLRGWWFVTDQSLSGPVTHKQLAISGNDEAQDRMYGN